MSKTYPELSKSGFDSNLYACNVIFTLWQGSADRIRTKSIKRRMRPGSEHFNSWQDMSAMKHLSELAGKLWWQWWSWWQNLYLGDFDWMLVSDGYVKRYWMLVTKMVITVTNILKFHQHIASPTSVTNIDVTLVAGIFWI